MFEFLFHGVRALFRDPLELTIENLALRQQLGAFVVRGQRPRIEPTDRAFGMPLMRGSSKWTGTPVFVKPETVVRWHREGFRRYWTWSSRPGESRRPAIDARARTLIATMASESPDRCAPRIHWEFLKLGFNVSERTVSSFLPTNRFEPDAIESWKTFRRNHFAGITARDLFQIPTVTLPVLYGWFAIGHDRRRILHFGVTDAARVILQLREAFPFAAAPCHLVFDRDTTFYAQVVATLKSFGTEPTRSAFGVCRNTESPSAGFKWNGASYSTMSACSTRNTFEHCSETSSPPITTMARTSGSTRTLLFSPRGTVPG